MKISKYVLPDFLKEINIPADAKLLHFAIQNGYAYIWLEANSNENKPFAYSVIGTAWDVPKDHTHFQTTLDQGFAWHLYIKN